LGGAGGAGFRQLATKQKTQRDLYKGFFWKTFKIFAIFLRKKEKKERFRQT
jgi:hypothetical protein